MSPKLLITALAVTVLGGCAGSGAKNAELERARAAVARAEQNPQVIQMAPVPLAEAREALARAENTVAGDAGEPEVEHRAYLARRQAELAEAHARIAVAEKSAQVAGERRTETIIEARERELARARAQAQTAELQARRAEEMAALEQSQATQRQEQTRTELEQLRQELSELKPQQTDRGVVLTLQDVLFDTNQAQLKPGAERSLDRLADFLKQSPGKKVLIEGHTDSRGSHEYNKDLSERRADAVKQEMVRRGVPADSIESKGLSENQPIANNNTPAGRQLNRRVEFLILQDEAARGG